MCKSCCIFLLFMYSHALCFFKIMMCFISKFAYSVYQWIKKKKLPKPFGYLLVLFIRFFLLFSSFSMLMNTLHSFSSSQVNISFLCHSSVSCKISYYKSLKLTDHMITLFRALIFINACHLRNSIFWYCPTLQNCNSFVFYIFSTPVPK